MEVNRVTGQTSIFLCDVPVNGIAFDPAGYMHLSIPSEDRIIRIGPNLPGDVNGSGVVDLGDVSGFAKALVTAPDAPLPVVAADMNGDGCANGKDIALFVSSLTE